MNYISLFTGIGGFDLAFNRAGHNCVAMVERDKAAQAVLRARFPGVPLFDDVVTFGRKDVHESVEIVVGGSPCQSFSVAGLRKSLGDDRGNLAFEFCRIVNEFTPRWIVWENVPGVISTKDNAFGNFLAALVGEDAAIVPPRGKWTNAGLVDGPTRSACWRILDAQFFGVPQRRRRVFVVAGAGVSSVAPVLFESEGVRRDSPPRRETRQGVAGFAAPRTSADVSAALSASGRGTSRTGESRGQDVLVVDAAVYDARGNGDGTLASAVTGDHANRVTDYTAVVVEPRYYTRDNKTGGAPSDVASITNAHKAGDSAPVVVQSPSATVRRLTAKECERLQAFPDGWTAQGMKPDGTVVDQADTPRYKQLGNAVCVNVVEWIARRIP